MPEQRKPSPSIILFLLIGAVLGAVLGYAISHHYVIEDFELRYVPTLTFADGGVYSGPLDDEGVASGHGRMEWTNGSYYEGNFAGGLYHGKGLFVGASGQEYEGDYSRGVEHGQARVKYVDGTEYRGDIVNGMLDGRGLMTFTDGRFYEGDFQQDKMTGEGRWVVPGSHTYIGGIKDALYDGRGELSHDKIVDDQPGDAEQSFNSGASYVGEFKAGLYHGQGIYQTADGDIYSGTFAYGVFTGDGSFKSSNGVSELGQFVDWRLQGTGLRTDADGNQFKGNFQYGELQGEGVYLGADGERYEGGFEYGRYQGSGTHINLKGDAYVGEFRYGVKHGKGELSYKEPIDGVSYIKGVWKNGTLKEASEGVIIYPATELAEFSLYEQSDLLDKQLAQLAKSSGEAINLYTLAVAGYGSEEVFSRELRFIEDNFVDQYSSKQHSVLLGNSRRALGERPLATLTSLERSINAISKNMDVEKDILFLYITSHGSKHKKIALEQSGLSLPDLEAEKLKSLLDNSGIKWKVIVLSACYSGGFIETLADQNTLIITSAAADKTSFGCDDNSLFTFFGEAFFKESLPESESFVEAFTLTEKHIAEWEEEQGYETSNPQISQPQSISEHLQKWRKYLRK